MRLAHILRAHGVVLAAAAMYAVSFAAPVFDPGFAKALHGWGAFRGAVQDAEDLPIWAANPVFWFALALAATGRTRAASRLALLAAGLATYGFVWWTNGVNPSGTTGLLAGYWLWLGSMLLLTFADLAARRARNPVRSTHHSGTAKGHA